MMKKTIALATLGMAIVGSAYGYSDATIAKLCPTATEVSEAIANHSSNLTRDSFLKMKDYNWKSGAEISHAKANQMIVKFLELNLASDGPLCGYEIIAASCNRGEGKLTRKNVKFMRGWDKEKNEKYTDYLD